MESRERTWTDEEIAKFDGKAEALDQEMLIARLIYSYTGQGTADVIGMNDTDYRVDPNGDRWLNVMQQKTSKRIWVHCHADLVPAIEAHIARRRAATEIFGGCALPTRRAEAADPEQERRTVQ